MRRSNRTLQILLLFATVLMLREARTIVLPVTIAVVLTFVLISPVHWLRRKGLPQPLGAGMVLCVILLSLGLIITTLAAPAADWIERAPTTARQLLDSLERVRAAILPPVANPLSSRRADRATPPQPPPAEALKDRLTSEGLNLTRVVIGQVLSFATSAAATVILLYFLLVSEPWLLSRTIEVVKPRRARLRVLSGIRQAQREIGLYLSTMSVINVALGAATGVALALLGIPNPVLWSTIAIVLNFIPYLGPALLTALLLLAGSMSFGASLYMLAPPSAFLILHAIESNFISPWVMGRRLHLAPLSVFLSVMLWGWLWGLGGALVAVPLLLGLRSVCRRIPKLRPLRLYLEGARTAPPSLRGLVSMQAKSRREAMEPGRPVAGSAGRVGTLPAAEGCPVSISASHESERTQP